MPSLLVLANSCVSHGTQLKRPPAAPSAPPPATTAPRTFAVSTFFLGETLGFEGPHSWRSLGYDLDGKATTAESRDVCTPSERAGREAQVDGEGGIDNAWGSRIVPLLRAVGSDVSQKLTDTVRAGAYTYLIELGGLSDDPKQTNSSVSGQVFLSAPFGRPPTFTRQDDWPVRESTLSNGQLAGGGRMRFPIGYINGGTWVSAPLWDILLELDLGPRSPSLRLTIHRGVVTFDHSSPTRATSGTVAGILYTEELVAAFKLALSAFSDSLCGLQLAPLVQQLRQASDILSDGTNRPGVPCDAISIGIGFEADEVANVSRVVPDPPTGGDPCSPPTSDAGESDASDAGRE